jgi:hypothetical protein
MPDLTRICLSCNGTGSIAGGACGVCRGAGSIRLSTAIPKPSPTIEDVVTQLQHVQRAVAAMLNPDGLPLVARRTMASEIRKDLERFEQTKGGES